MMLVKISYFSKSPGLSSHVRKDLGLGDVWSFAFKKKKYEIIDFVQSFAEASLPLKGAIIRTTLMIMKDAKWIIGLSGLRVHY